ncbi:ESCRT-0 subunit protein hse1 [Dimargaris verticillata]|uniref:Class E vacuolar protein-sorting machinery protein HSE1 n=1 Tax=Dimargaris verticillata TaxID=2761393 RepID=A0A9W8EBS1_9FUNG|nr:ESCRT-0 subunit protein hse1 [Dimargaris verticillata]
MFRTTNPFESLVNKATSEELLTENWDLNLRICEKIGQSETNARDCMAAINKRLLHRNANVVLYTLSLTEALVKNCGKTMQREVSSRAFTSTLVRVLNDKTVHEVVKKRVLELVQQWSFDFRTDPDLGLMEETYHRLQKENFVFPSPQKPEKVPTQGEIDRQKEEDELQLALALSLSESEQQKQQRQHGQLSSTSAPSSSSAQTHQPSATNASKPHASVKALFDFSATESGELGFFKGDIIEVLDQKYKDWWKGKLRDQVGIFPANYVQIIREPTQSELAREYEMEAQVLKSASQVDSLLRMLDAAGEPNREHISENEELQLLYHNVLSIRPSLVQLIEKYTQKKDDMISLNEKLSRTLQSYDTIVQNSAAASQPSYPPSAQHPYPPQSQYPQYAHHHPQPQPYGGTQPAPGHSSYLPAASQHHYQAAAPVAEGYPPAPPVYTGPPNGGSSQHTSPYSQPPAASASGYIHPQPQANAGSYVSTGVAPLQMSTPPGPPTAATGSSGHQTYPPSATGPGPGYQAYGGGPQPQPYRQ